MFAKNFLLKKRKNKMKYNEVRKFMKYKALVTDIDGTLLNNEHTVSAENIAAIARLRDAGYHFVLASGRPDKGMEAVVKACGLEGKENYLIAFNGGKIVRTDTGEVLFSEGLDPAAFEFFYNYTKEHEVSKGLSICSYTATHVIGSSASEGMDVEAMLTSMPVKVVDDMVAELEGCFLPKAIMFSDAETVAAVYQELLPFAAERNVELAISNPTFLEITARGINKGKTLHKLADILGISIAEILAVGDGGNDLTMIQEAGLGVAVENAADVLKNAADAFTVHHNDHAIEALVAEYFLGK